MPPRGTPISSSALNNRNPPVPCTISMQKSNSSGSLRSGTLKEQYQPVSSLSPRVPTSQPFTHVRCWSDSSPVFVMRNAFVISETKLCPTQLLRTPMQRDKPRGTLTRTVFLQWSFAELDVLILSIWTP